MGERQALGRALGVSCDVPGWIGQAEDKPASVKPATKKGKGKK